MTPEGKDNQKVSLDVARLANTQSYLRSKRKPKKK